MRFGRGRQPWSQGFDDAGAREAESSDQLACKAFWTAFGARSMTSK
jgi:hypothetical protein